jgi:hypothetical protein
MEANAFGSSPLLARWVSGSVYTQDNECMTLPSNDHRCLDYHTLYAAQPGPPQSGKTCSGSPEAVSDTIPSPGGFTAVADINAIWQGPTEVGWMYLGTNGDRYIQANYQTQAGYNWSLSVGFASFGSSTPGGYSSVDPWGGKLPRGSRVVNCFQAGKTLV